MIYVLILLIFVDGDVVQSRMIGQRTAADCAAAEERVAEEAKTAKLSVVTACVPITVPEVPRFKKDRDS